MSFSNGLTTPTCYTAYFQIDADRFCKWTEMNTPNPDGVKIGDANGP